MTADREQTRRDADQKIRCEDCGIDLTLTEFEVRRVRRSGNPLYRPPCSARDNGAHRVSDAQLRRFCAVPYEEQA